MLSLMVLVFLVGLGTTKLTPTHSRQEGTLRDHTLRTALAEIRQALEIKRFLNPLFIPDFSTPQKVFDELTALKLDRLLLSEALIDPTVPQKDWGKDKTYFWVPVINLIRNPSFESTLPPDPAKNECKPFWASSTFDTLVATDSVYYPSRNTSRFDEFPSQNKFGVFFAPRGHAIRVIR
jgi:hypothetical protein